MVGGIGRIEGPGELCPGPPYEPEREDDLACCTQIDAVLKQCHDLRHAEHKHQVEEQFDPRDFLVYRGCERLCHRLRWTLDVRVHRIKREAKYTKNKMMQRTD